VSFHRRSQGAVSTNSLRNPAMALSVGSSDDNWNSEFDRDRPVSAEQWMAHSPAGVGSCPVYRNLDRRDGTFAIRSPGSRVRDHDGVASRVSGTLVHARPGSCVHQIVRFRGSVLDTIPWRLLGTCDHSSDRLVLSQDNRDYSCDHALQVDISACSSGPIVTSGMDHAPNAINRQYCNRIFRRRWSTRDLTTDDGPDIPSLSHGDRSERRPCACSQRSGLW